MVITGRTKVLGIFGDPVEQTLSPYMHNAAFKALGLDHVYVPFHVAPDGLEAGVEAVRALGLLGVNVTIPHKERVMEFLDEVDEEARAIGAVNTIVNRSGRLAGHNTDGRGYWMSLMDETGFDPAGKTIIVLGAGGAARAIIFSLLGRGPARVVVANRTRERAEALKEAFKNSFPEVDMVTTGLDAPGEMEGADLLVNTTSVGMLGSGGDAPPVDVGRLPSSAVVSDIVFKPLDTPLIRDAEKRGLRTHRGLGMLVCQGALSFELWTGKRAPVETMKFAALQALEVR